MVNRDPVVFPSIEDRVSGASPIVLCLLDDPPNPSVEQIVRGAADSDTLRHAPEHQSDYSYTVLHTGGAFLRAFFMREACSPSPRCPASPKGLAKKQPFRRRAKTARPAGGGGLPASVLHAGSGGPGQALHDGWHSSPRAEGQGPHLPHAEGPLLCSQAVPGGPRRAQLLVTVGSYVRALVLLCFHGS